MMSSVVSRLALSLLAAPALFAQSSITLNDGDDNAVAYDIADTLTLEVTDSGTAATQSGVLSGAGALITSGEGTLTLAATNTYAGGTTVSGGGTLAVSGIANLGTGGLGIDGGTLSLLGDLDTGSRAVSTTEAGGALETNGYIATLSSVQSAGPLARLGTGSLLLKGDSTVLNSLYNDENGELTVDTGASLTVGNGTTSFGVVAGPLTVNGSIILKPSLVEDMGYYGGSPGGPGISGTGTLLKQGPGRLIISNANTYTGGTTLSEGLVSIQNGTGSAFGPGGVTVQSGATLDGDGYFSGPLTLNAGATLSPGRDDAPGYITIGDGSSLNGTTLIEVGEIEGDLVSDTIEVGADGSGGVILGGTLKVVFWGGWTPTGSASFQLFEATSIGGSFAQYDLPGTTGYVWNTSRLGVDGVLELVAIPEPSAWAASAACVALAFAARRRSRRARAA